MEIDYEKHRLKLFDIGSSSTHNFTCFPLPKGEYAHVSHFIDQESTRQESLITKNNMIIFSIHLFAGIFQNITRQNTLY